MCAIRSWCIGELEVGDRGWQARTKTSCTAGLDEEPDLTARPVPPCSSSSRRPAHRYAHALEGYTTCGQGSSCCQHRSQPMRLGASSFGAATAQKLPSAHRQATGGRSSASVAQRVTCMTVLGGPKNSGCGAVWDSLCLCMRVQASGIRVNSCGANPRTGP